MKKSNSHEGEAELTGHLDFTDGFFCVVTHDPTKPEPVRVGTKRWWPIAKMPNAEVQTLLGLPVTRVDAGEGIYIDEEGRTYRLTNDGNTKPIREERMDTQKVEQEAPGTASLNGRQWRKQSNRGKRKKVLVENNGSAASAKLNGSGRTRENVTEEAGSSAVATSPAHMTLRQKLGEVRRRIGYIRKRGHNELHNYSYVTAADIAGTVGDILAELGVVVIPRLESISYAPNAPGHNAPHIARVIMAYTFADENCDDEITVKVAGEGLDIGDKAGYKAMTGALKYALLQSFLLATGDDPEEEHAHSRVAVVSEPTITPEQVRELGQLILETDTELERVLAHYGISALSDMTESAYRRTLQILTRKLSKQGHANGVHASN